MSMQNLKDSLTDIESQSEPYRALHFVAGVIQVIGWAGLIMHTIVIIAFGYPFIRTKIVEDLAIYAIAFLAWGVGLTPGIFIIAQGQLIDLLLDIRNDIRITRRYTRRFGLHFARRIENKETE